MNRARGIHEARKSFTGAGFLLFLLFYNRLREVNRFRFRHRSGRPKRLGKP